MGLLSNRIGKETLKAGDHIYSWRAKRAYAHHGIYADDDKVIHFTRGGGQEAGTGTVIDVLLVSFSPIRSTPCLVCRSYKVTASTRETNGVTPSCLSCFLAGGDLYLFEYGVSTPFFFAKVRGGTCTRASADPHEVVVRRANHLLKNGFRCYSLFKNNCEDFAIYCKTGLLVAEQGSAGIGQSGQAVSMFGAGASIIGAGLIAVPVYFATRYASGDVANRRAVLEEEAEDQVIKKEEEDEDQTAGEACVRGEGISVIAAAASIIGGLIAVPAVYCATRFSGDIGSRRGVLKVEVEDLTAGLASGQIRPMNMATPGHVQVLAVTTLVAA